MADGTQFSAPRRCPHPGCGTSFVPTTRRGRYCPEHCGQKWDSWRFRHRMREDAPSRLPRRSEQAIRTDLAAQLTAQVRRFDSMVAHDRATHPLE